MPRPLTDDDEPTDNDGADPKGAPTEHPERLRDAMDKREDQAMRDPMRKLKSLDAVAICKTMSAEGRAFGLSEHDLVDLIDNYAKAHGSSFAKMFTAQDDTGLALRKAVNIAKNAQFISRTATMSKAATLTPSVVGGADARAVNQPKAALDQMLLNGLLVSMRTTRRSPSRSGEKIGR
jgi:hypothetical protein